MESYIGVFDSGMGGITVLVDLMEALPDENFIYFGDSAHAPYGILSQEEVYELTDQAVSHLVDRGAKLVVLACNTATSAAVDRLRAKYDIPIIGMEPAIKPALEAAIPGDIAVLATPMTLSLEKFNHLLNQLKGEDRIHKIPAPELVEYVEKGIFTGKRIAASLRRYFGSLDREAIGSVVLGCTHFLYLEEALEDLFSGRIRIFNGNHGTVNRVIQILSERDLESRTGGQELLIENSGPSEMIDQSRRLFKAYQQIKRNRLQDRQSKELRREKVRNMILESEIDPRSKEMILDRYGLSDDHVHSAEEIGKKYGLRGRKLKEELDKLERMAFNILKSENIYDIISQN